MDNLKLDELTRLNDDVCHNGNVLQQNDNINDYMLSNFASCDCNINEVLGVFNPKSWYNCKRWLWYFRM